MSGNQPLDRYPDIPWHIEQFSKAPRVKFEWPNGARLAVLVHTAFEAWSEIQSPAVNWFRSIQSDAPPGGWLPAGATTEVDFVPATEHDYGGRTGIWRVLDLYKKYEIPGTFATSGLCTERYPDAVKAIVQQGHEIAAHAWAQDIRHSILPPEIQRADIQRCVSAFEHLTGQRPHGWISPGGGSTEHTARFLVAEGFNWYGDPKNDDDPYAVTIDGAPLIVIGSKRGRTGVNAADIIKQGENRDLYHRFVDEFDGLYEESATRPRMITAVMHAELQTAGANRVFDDMIQYARRHTKLWFATRGMVARHLLDHYVR